VIRPIHCKKNGSAPYLERGTGKGNEENSIILMKVRNDPSQHDLAIAS